MKYRLLLLMFALSVCLPVCLSHGLNRRWRMQCVPCAWGHSVQPSPNAFGLLFPLNTVDVQYLRQSLFEMYFIGLWFRRYWSAATSRHWVFGDSTRYIGYWWYIGVVCLSHRAIVQLCFSLGSLIPTFFSSDWNARESESQTSLEQWVSVMLII